MVYGRVAHHTSTETAGRAGVVEEAWRREAGDRESGTENLSGLRWRGVGGDDDEDEGGIEVAVVLRKSTEGETGERGN
jgi:hypothetical protein